MNENQWTHFILAVLVITVALCAIGVRPARADSRGSWESIQNDYYQQQQLQIQREQLKLQKEQIERQDRKDRQDRYIDRRDQQSGRDWRRHHFYD